VNVEAQAHSGVVVVPMTEDTVAAAARIHLQVLPGSRTALMGLAYVRSWVDWFRRPEHQGVAFAAITAEGEVVGYVIGAPLGYPTELSRDLFWPSIAAFAARPWLILMPQFRHGVFGRLRLTVWGTLPREAGFQLPAPTMSLVAMGVSPAFRRARVGHRLLDESERRAVGMNMRSMHLSTESDNMTAQQFYERYGWRPLSKSADKVHYGRIL